MTDIYLFNSSKVLSTFIYPEVTLQISPQQTKISISTQAIHCTFKQLQKEGQIDECAKILLHTDKKLVTGLEIV
jgi:predicted transcriptional regulator